MAQDDLLCAQFLPVQVLVSMVIGAQRGTIQRYSSENPTIARPRKDLCFHHNVGLRCGSATYRPGSNRGVTSQLHFTRHNRGGASLVHHKKDKVCGLPADLKAEAAS